MHGGEPAHHRVISHLNMTSQSAVVGENDVIADRAIVPNMAVSEKIAAIADARFAFTCRAAVCRHEFTKSIFVADFQIGRLAAIL